MRINHVLTLAVSLSFIGAVPAWAYQNSGGGAQHGNRSTPVSQTPRGTNQLRGTDQARGTNQQKDRNTIYGSQLMTPAERSTYRKQMRSLKTDQERKAFRKQHHEQMQKRAAERGMSLPDMPPQSGGMGPGGGMGQGSGMNQGAGAGMRQRTMQQTGQQQRNAGKDQKIQQQDTRRETQQSTDNKDN